MMEAMAIMMVTFSVAFATIMVVIHFFSSCSINIVYNECLFDDDDSDSHISWNSDASDVSSSHWGTESNPGIERLRSSYAMVYQLRELQRIDREAFRMFFQVSEAVSNHRSRS